MWQQGQGPDDTSIETFAQNNSNYRAWRYGYFEARMKWDVTTGAWPAFWLTPVETALGLDFYNGVQEQGEFDIFEGQGDEPHTFFGTIHDWKNGVGTANSNNTWPLGQSVDFSQYHTYGMLWTPGQVTWYFDNQPLMSAPTPAVVDQQHYLMILAMQRRGRLAIRKFERSDGFVNGADSGLGEGMAVAFRNGAAAVCADHPMPSRGYAID